MVTTYDPQTNTVLTSATVNIYNPGTVTPISATIFDKSGNILSNPLTSDATTALIDFYLNVAQEVDLVVSKGGFTTRTYSNVPVLDDSSLELTALLTTTGDIVYASSANTPARLPIGSTLQPMTVIGGVPAWGTLLVTVASGTVTATNITVGGGVTDITGGSISIVSGGNYLIWGIIDAADTSGSANTITGIIRDGSNNTVANTPSIVPANGRIPISLLASGVISSTTLKLSAQASTGNAQIGAFSQIRVMRVG